MLTSDQNGSSKPKASNTGAKLVEAGKATRFQKGDPRINRNGRPKTFDQARALAQAIAHEVERVDPDGAEVTVAEAVLRAWSQSRAPQLQKAFIEYAFGKVPDKLEATGLEQKPVLILHYAHERQNAEQN